MNERPLQKRSIQEILHRVSADGPPEARIIHCGGEEEWNPSILCNISRHELHVLERSTDIIVFFDSDGNVIGWRDDGRTGAEMPAWVDRDSFLNAVVNELDLPEETRLGQLQPVELPPLGWTHGAVLFLKTVPQPEDILRVWASPDTLRVIQCLYDRSPFRGKKP